MINHSSLRQKITYLACCLFGVALILSAYQYGRISVREPSMASRRRPAPPGRLLAVSTPPGSADVKDSDLMAAGGVFSAHVERRALSGQEHLIVRGFALPIPKDGPNLDASMLSVIGLTGTCHPQVNCPVMLFSRSRSIAEPSNWYSPVSFEVVDLQGMTPEAWARSPDAERHSILYPERAKTHINRQGISITELVTDRQMGQGGYYLLSQPNQPVGILIFDLSGAGEIMAERAKLVESSL